MDRLLGVGSKGVYTVLGMIITGLAAVLWWLIKYVAGEEKGKAAKSETKVDELSAELKDTQHQTDNKLAEAERRTVQQLSELELRISGRIDKIESQVGGIVTGDIAQLYREITTLQGDIKVLASELKNLNSNIQTMITSMRDDITSTIAQALSGK